MIRLRFRWTRFALAAASTAAFLMAISAAEAGTTIAEIEVDRSDAPKKVDIYAEGRIHRYIENAELVAVLLIAQKMTSSARLKSYQDSKLIKGIGSMPVEHWSELKTPLLAAAKTLQAPAIPHAGQPPSATELINWADSVLKASSRKSKKTTVEIGSDLKSLAKWPVILTESNPISHAFAEIMNSLPLKWPMQSRSRSPANLKIIIVRQPSLK